MRNIFGPANTFAVNGNGLAPQGLEDGLLTLALPAHVDFLRSQAGRGEEYLSRARYRPATHLRVSHRFDVMASAI